MKCMYCGHEARSRVANPYKCPRCGNPYNCQPMNPESLTGRYRKWRLP